MCFYFCFFGSFICHVIFWMVKYHLNKSPLLLDKSLLLFAMLYYRDMKHYVRIIILLLLSPLSFSFYECFDISSKRYGIDVNLLKAIAFTESSMNPNALSKKNKNGTYDIGLMQINSSWFEKLRLRGIKKSELSDPCINIDVGSWILSENIKQYGKKWNAVGIYNAGTGEGRGKAKMLYVRRVYYHYARLVRLYGSSAKT